MTLTYRYTARTHVGRVREGNEDSAYAGPGLLVVADGMGGHAAGEIASAATINVLRELDAPPPDVVAAAAALADVEMPLDAEASRDDAAAGAPTEEVFIGDPADVPPEVRLRSAIVRANERLRELSDRNTARRGMGTTVTALLWEHTRFVVAHMGDSRAYLCRDGALEQITHDHTYVQTLVDEGRITEAEAELHPQRSLILRALDGRGNVELDIFDVGVRAGDRVLVCSDGLSGVVSMPELQLTIATGELEDVADELIAKALAGGAPDNVTCIVAEVIETRGDGLDDTATMPTLDAHGRPVRGLLVGAVAEVDPDAAPDPEADDGLELPDRHLRDAEDLDPEEALRYAPRLPGRFRWLRRLGVTALVLAVLCGIGYAGWVWTRTQYYVGVSGDKVAVFRGLDQQIAGQSMSSVVELSDVNVTDLPVFDRTRLAQAIPAASLDDARAIAERLGVRADACIVLRNQPTPAPTPTGTPPSTTSPPPANTTSTSSPTAGQTASQTGSPPGSATPAQQSTMPLPTTFPPSTFAPTTPGTATTLPSEGPSEPDPSATIGGFDTTVTRAECGLGR